jgi:glutamate N-acetyltransferase/amino-acid N-acetyltransferase
MPSKEDNISIPEGFLFSVASARIRYKNRNDIALIYSVVPSRICGTFTTNRIKAAPVILDMRKIRRGIGQALFINSGNANACTGTQGYRDAERICKELASRLGISERDVYLSSTGVIGERLPIKNVLSSIDNLIKNLGRATPTDIAKAIMTTDRFPKVYSKTVELGSYRGSILGICKGAGMISPKMATMLCFILTDLAVERETLKKTLKESVKETFNLITVDGDMSTNDTVLMMANGVAENPLIKERAKFYKRFRDSVLEVTDTLARMIASDGEGATRLIIVRVKGAKTAQEASKVAFAIARSPLVKTAIYGADANWGRIMAAIGYSSVPVREERIDIRINGIEVVKKGSGRGRDIEASRSISESSTVEIEVNLHRGKATERIYTCDLTEEYVRINAAYRT